MKKMRLSDLGKRERQLVEAVYRLGEASVSDVLGSLPDPPSYSSVRAMLGVLVGKGLLKYRRDGTRYVYRPATPAEEVRDTALHNLIATFFSGRATDAMAALLETSSSKLSNEDLDRIRLLIDQAQKEDR